MNKQLSKTGELTDKHIMNTYKRLPIAIEKGEGMYLYDEQGKKYLDFTSGIAVNSLGYKNPKFIEAMLSQAELLNHCSNLYYSKPQSELAEKLTQNSCFDKVFFCNSGAESIEAAMKLCRKFGHQKKDGCNQIIAMKNSFHGRTFGAVSATGQEKYHKGFYPLLPGVLHAEFNNIESVKNLMTENTCAVITEPIQGEGGVVPANVKFLQELREICTKNDILLVFDEVQTGIGRTGKLFAYQNYGVEPDVICLAKGLGNGLPIGAMMANAKASSVFTPGNHASTFGGNPLVTACAKVVLDEIECNNLLENVQKTSDYLKAELGNLKLKHSEIKEVRGLGLMLGVEFSTPVSEIVQACQEQGLLLISAGEKVIRFIPPLIASIDDAAAAIAIFSGVLKELNT